MAYKRSLEVTEESTSGRNLEFRDTHTGKRLTRGEAADAIEHGQYPDYHVRVTDRKRTPAANPDGNKKNNLG